MAGRRRARGAPAMVVVPIRVRASRTVAAVHAHAGRSGVPTTATRPGAGGVRPPGRTGEPRRRRPAAPASIRPRGRNPRRPFGDHYGGRRCQPPGGKSRSSPGAVAHRPRARRKSRRRNRSRKLRGRGLQTRVQAVRKRFRSCASLMRPRASVRRRGRHHARLRPERRRLRPPLSRHRGRPLVLPPDGGRKKKHSGDPLTAAAGSAKLVSLRLLVA